MTAALMVYAVIVSVPLAVAAWVFEHVATERGWPRRTGWALALAVTLALLLLTPWQGIRSAIVIAPSPEAIDPPANSRQLTSDEMGPAQTMRILLRDARQDVVNVPPVFERVAQWGWMSATAAL